MSIKSGTERLLLVLLFLSAIGFLFIHLFMVWITLTDPMPQGMSMSPEEMRNFVLGISFGSLLTSLYFPISTFSSLRRAKIRWLALSLLGLAFSLLSWFLVLSWLFETSKFKSTAADLLSSFLGGTLATLAVFTIMTLILKTIGWVIRGFNTAQEKT